jgi:hypothetical protein
MLSQGASCYVGGGDLNTCRLASLGPTPLRGHPKPLEVSGKDTPSIHRWRGCADVLRCWS